jgi:hypothetical protein
MYVVRNRMAYRVARTHRMTPYQAEYFWHSMNVGRRGGGTAAPSWFIHLHRWLSLVFLSVWMVGLVVAVLMVLVLLLPLLYLCWILLLAMFGAG